MINRRIPNGLVSTNHPRTMQGVINYSTHARIGKKRVYACVSRNELERILESKRDRIIITEFTSGDNVWKRFERENVIDSVVTIRCK